MFKDTSSKVTQVHKEAVPSCFFTLEDNKLNLVKNWTLINLNEIQANLNRLPKIFEKLSINFEDIQELDSAGAWLIQNYLNKLKKRKIPFEIKNCKTSQAQLLKLAEKYYKVKTSIQEKPPLLNPFARIGRAAFEIYEEMTAWLNFIGEVFITTFNVLKHPSRIRWTYLFVAIENNGYHALPIVGFLSFLVGMVLTYQIGLELETYGANIFIINLLGLAIFREFGPLMTAIIITGRTGSAFTAQLGLMKSNEEIDALKTMGHSPQEVLIIPRMLGMMVVMPLLTIWANIFGILGGMVMSKATLGINYYDFISRFPAAVSTTSFTVGMVKAPVFAIIIATVGCFHGMRVSGSSESIGLQTTKSVVMAIFMIIITDAAFSIILSWLDI